MHMDCFFFIKLLSLENHCTCLVFLITMRINFHHDVRMTEYKNTRKEIEREDEVIFEEHKINREMMKGKTLCSPWLTNIGQP